MKTKRSLTAAVLALTMLLAMFGSGFTATALTVTTDSEPAYEPLAETASIAYEKHGKGYAVSLDRAADSVTMNITAVPGSRAAEKAQLYVHTGVELKPGVDYRVSFSLSAEREQPEYAVCLDGGAAECAYGRLDKRSVAAGGMDKVDYRFAPEKEGGELVLRLLLGKTGAEGNTLRLSDLAVEEAVGEEIGESRVIAENLDYSEPGAITCWANEDSGASVTSDGSSATLTVTRTPATGAEVWKIKLMVATGLKPEAGKTYRISYDVKASAAGEFEVCYNEGDVEKGYDVQYSQRLSAEKETRSRRIYVPEDRENPGELILQLSLGKLGKGTRVTVSNVRVEEAVATYKDALAKDFAYDKRSSIREYDPNNYDVTRVITSTPIALDGKMTATCTGDNAGSCVYSGDRVTQEIKGGTNCNDYWGTRLDIDTHADLDANKKYLVSFQIKSNVDYSRYDIFYGTALRDTWNNMADYGKLEGCSLKAGQESTVSYQFDTDTTKYADLVITLHIGATGNAANTVTVSNIKIEEVPNVNDYSTIGKTLADVDYPSDSDNISFGVTNGGPNRSSASIDGNAIKLVVTEAGESWDSKLYIKTGITPENDETYDVSFDIRGENEQPNWEINYSTLSKEKRYGAVYSPETIPSDEALTVKKTIPLDNSESGADGELWIVLLLGKTKNTYWISNIEVNGQDCPSIDLGSFDVRSDEDNHSGAVTGTGTSATLSCIGGPGDGLWRRGLFINDICELSPGTSYEVSFNITSNVDTDYDILYNKNDKWNEKGFGEQGGLSINRNPNPKYIINSGAGGTLFLRIDLGKAAAGTEVTVSGIQVKEIKYNNTLPLSLGSFNSISMFKAGEAEEWTVNLSDSAKLDVTKGEIKGDFDGPETWMAKMIIHTGEEYDSSKAYRLKFNIQATEPQNEFVVVAQNVPNDDKVDIRGTWGLSIPTENVPVSVETRPFPGRLGKGEVAWAIELGKLDDNVTSNTFTVSNIVLEEVTIEPRVLGSRIEGTVTSDAQPGYGTTLTREKDSATLSITSSPDTGAEAWKSKLFLNTGVSPQADEAYRVTFDVLTEEDADFEVCYNCGDREKGYDAIYGLHTEGGKVRTVERVFTAERAGTLIVQLSLGMVKAPNAVTINNLKVERISYTYSGKSALPAELSYKAPGAVSYWAHEDYAAAFTGTGSAVTANITRAPKTGAEPWKIKLFLDTGTPLEAGKYYKVTADVKAGADQDYEICYNNGGAEMGYSSQGGLHLVAGKAQTVEKTFAVPGGKADLGNLTLQLNLGKTTAANEITVSGVKVEELPISYVNAMAADFSYKGAVELQADPDYTATLEKSDANAKLHITGVPATGAGVWKVKLLVNTGAVLQAGRTYLVRADLLAAKGQGYEVCFNNEETEKGFDVLYGQTFTAGSKTTVERTISVPESMTDAGELVLQFSVGGDVTNDITVSGVSVQELDFGAGKGIAAPDTVISLRSAAGTLDVTREKLSCKLEKTAGNDALTVAGADLRANDVYTVTFRARADRDLTGTFALNQAGGAAVISEQFKLTAEMAEYSFTTKQPLSAGGLYDMLWQFASPDGQTSGSADVEISDISVYSPPERLEIVHSAQSVTVNGKAAAPDIYNINGFNYFKLRDLAMLLNDTDGQFVVRYNKKDDSVSLTTGKAYVPVGGELTAMADQAASCVRSPQTVAVDGGRVNLKAYNIGGSNYFRLRELGDLLGFTVDYIARSNTVSITSPLTPEAQEKAHGYDIFFLPGIDSESQGYVGDTMPYYENGVYYIYYLKEGGDSYNHSVYLTTTTDFVSYTEYDEPVLSASREDVQDSWIGTGSVVKVEGTYYFFYTGFNSSGSQEYHEKIMVAKGSTPTSFEKVGGWEITPPAELGQKNDFRDPQAYYDAESKTISLTVTASQDSAARILKYTLGKDLKNVSYDGIIFTDPTGAFFNLECSDTFRIGNKWYLTYSGQDDTLWYAMADSRFGPYSAPARLDGKLFYAAKHVEDGTNAYMVGWARRSNSASSTNEVSGWAGNIAVQKLSRQPDGSLSLVPVDSIVSSFGTQMQLALGADKASLKAGPDRSYEKAFTSCESFMLSGEFTYSGIGSFGLAFDFNGQEEQYKLISIDPEENRLSLSLNGGAAPITGTQAALEENKTHSFTYIQDGSVGIFYLDGRASLTVRLYGVTDKPVYLFAENNSVEFTSLRQYT